VTEARGRLLEEADARGGDEGDVVDGRRGDPHGVRVPPDLEPVGAVHHLIRRALVALARRRHRRGGGDEQRRGDGEQAATPRHALALLACAAATGAGLGWGLALDLRPCGWGLAVINTLLCPRHRSQDACGAGASTSLAFECLAIVRDLGVLLDSTGVRLAAEARRKHPVLLVSESFFFLLLGLV